MIQRDSHRFQRDFPLKSTEASGNARIPGENGFPLKVGPFLAFGFCVLPMIWGIKFQWRNGKGLESPPSQVAHLHVCWNGDFAWFFVVVSFPCVWGIGSGKMSYFDTACVLELFGMEMIKGSGLLLRPAMDFNSVIQEMEEEED